MAEGQEHKNKRRRLEALPKPLLPSLPRSSSRTVSLLLLVKGGRVPNRNKNHASKESKHNPFTHFPKCPNCPICNETKSTRAQCRSKSYGKPDELPKPLKFGHSITAGHKILNDDDDASREADKVAMITLDRYSRWLQGYACKTKSASECIIFLKRFVDP